MNNKQLEKASKKELITLALSLNDKITILENQLNETTETLEKYIEMIKVARKGKFIPSSENTAQLSLFDEAEFEADETISEPAIDEVMKDKKLTKKKVKKSKRLNLKGLKETVKIHDLSEEEKICDRCETPLRKIGEDIRHEVIMIPAHFEVIKHIRYVYSCDECDKYGEQSTIVKAEFPNQVIPKSIVSAELLSSIITDKYQKSLPLYRQEICFEELGLSLSRANMSNWIIKADEYYFKSIVALMNRDILESDYIQADETTTQVLKEPGKEAREKSYMWVHRTGRSEPKKIITYTYEADRKHEHAENHLKGFNGIVQSDGYQAYGKVKEVILAGCWAHGRRPFYNALEALSKTADKKLTVSYDMLVLINDLFKIERTLHNKSYDEITEIRQLKSKPIVKEIFERAKEALPRAAKGTELHKGLTYLVNQEDKLSAFLEDGRIELSTNKVENAIRPFCVGKKNWLFANTPRGAKASADIYSIVETAKLNHLKVYDYFVYLLKQMRNLDVFDTKAIEKLLPYSNELPNYLYNRKKTYV